MPEDITLTLASTSRQILLSYTAPDTNACTVEVSESASYSPVVNDVNSTLFSGANSDARTGALGAGTTNRSMVIGTIQQPNGVTPLVAGDSNTYSRCLQVNTTHYVRVTCGTHTGTGSIATKNRPLGITYDEPMPITAAGVYGFPTLSATNRDEMVIDPQFGTKLKKVSITGDNSWAGSGDWVEFSENGAQWPWTQSTINDSSGNPGYIAQVLTYQAYTRLYWVNTAASSGVARHLGYMQLPTGTSGYPSHRYPHALSSLSPSNEARQIYSIFLNSDTPTTADAHVWCCTLPASGNSYYDQSVPEDGTLATCSWSNPTSASSLSAKIDAFVTANGLPTFDKTKFNSFFYQNVQGDYLLFTVARGAQNSYAWNGVYKISTNELVALMPPHRGGNGTTTNQRFCGFHTSQPNLGSNFMSWENHDLVNSTGPGSGGSAGYTTTTTASMDNEVTVITLTSNTPTSVEDETTLYAFAVGDEIWVDANEVMYLTSFVSGTTWNVSRGNAGTSPVSHSSGATVRAGCRCHDPNDYTAAAIMTWDFLNDPTGANTNGTYVKAMNDGVSGHYSWANQKKIGSGWKGCVTGADPEPCGTTLTFLNSPAFNGVTKNYGGNAGMMHASSVHQSSASTAEKIWGVDFIHPYSDADAIPTSVTNITGTLFKLVLPVTLDLKNLPLVAFDGLKRMLDISSPATGDVIGGTSGDYHKICIAYKVNECRTGSSVGDIYVNGPNLATDSTCPPWILPQEGPTTSALCVFNGPGSGTQNLLQIGITEGYTNGKYLRALTHGLEPYKQVNVFANGQATPDGNWIAFIVQDGTTNSRQNLWMVKVPPFPTYDSVDRNTFIQKTIAVDAVGGADNAIIEFGYDPSFYCTSRSEVCVSAASNNPYFFSASDSYSGVSCASGCNINIPVIPDRTVYYRIKWRNGTTPVQTSDTFMLMEDSAPVGGGGDAPSVGPSVKLIAICT